MTLIKSCIENDSKCCSPDYVATACSRTEMLACLGIMGPQLRAPEPPPTSRNYGTEGLKRGPKLVP